MTILFSGLICLSGYHIAVSQEYTVSSDLQKEVVLKRDSLISNILERVEERLQLKYAISDSLLLCKCSMGMLVSTYSGYKSRDVYIFLVKGQDELDCCDKPALTEYSGFQEKWHNETANPSVWTLPDSSKIEIESALAQELGCRLNGRTIDALRVNDFRQSAYAHYPNLRRGD